MYNQKPIPDEEPHFIVSISDVDTFETHTVAASHSTFIYFIILSLLLLLLLFNIQQMVL